MEGALPSQQTRLCKVSASSVYCNYIYAWLSSLRYVCTTILQQVDKWYERTHLSYSLLTEPITKSYTYYYHNDIVVATVEWRLLPFVRISLISWIEPAFYSPIPLHPLSSQMLLNYIHTHIHIVCIYCSAYYNTIVYIYVLALSTPSSGCSYKVCALWLRLTTLQDSLESN